MNHSPSILILLILSIILLSCSNGINKKSDDLKDSVNAETGKKLEGNNHVEDKIYFRATGTEPFWGMEISENTIKLTTIGDSIITPHTHPIHAMDANVKMYKIQTESLGMTVQIVQSECANAMSGKISPYKVTIDYRENIDEKLTTLLGCGDYITDYRLHDIWVLEKMNGKDIREEDISKEFPMLEINSTTNKFVGFAGCNRINGSLFSEKELIRFTDIATTEMMCDAFDIESEFLKALQSTTGYKIENNRLTLSNPDKKLLIFKKID
ncbi:META domain-containing protein [Belliella marina]|uniref:META domain-containing protein n=1 Tax=Belliella marina TaxID=1644146 RepID=A0ABW4VIT4_9BACT